MRRSDDVFFFTLIDFLLQVFFFGLLLFVVWLSLKGDEDHVRTIEAKQKEDLLKAAGISSITELTDRLTKMAPLDHLRGTADFIARNGGEKNVEMAIKAINSVGGAEKAVDLKNQNALLEERVSRLEGWGKVSCIPNVVVNGKLQPKSIATVIVRDDTILLQDPAPEMLALLKSHGMDLAKVERLSPAAFRTAFAPVVAKQPECRYFVTTRAETRYLDPMRAVWSAFRTP